MIHQLAPEWYIILRNEIPKHPQLVADLATCADDMDQLKTITAYCGIILDGAYTQEMLETALKDCLVILQDMSASIVVPIH